MREKSLWWNVTEDESHAKMFFDGLRESLDIVGKSELLNPETAEVLDIGGGFAEFSKYLKKQGIFCISLDIRNMPKADGAYQEKASIYNLPYDDNTFTVINATAIFDDEMYTQHDYSTLFKELARVLKPGGVFVTMDFHAYDHYVKDGEEYPHQEEIDKYFNVLASSTSFILEKK